MERARPDDERFGADARGGLGRATLTLQGPTAVPPASAEAMVEEGAAFWPLRLAREVDDAILHLRLNEPEIGVLIFKSQGESAQVAAYDAFVDANKDH